MIPRVDPSTEGFSVNIYGDCFENGERVQTYTVHAKETARELIEQILRRNHLNLKDPNLFYLSFQIDPIEVLRNGNIVDANKNYTTMPANHSAVTKPSGILYSNAILARTLNLRKDNRITLHTSPGKVLRIYDNCFSRPPSIRQIYVSRTTCCEEVIELILNLVGSCERPEKYCLVEEDVNEKSRILRDKDYPFLITQMSGSSAVLILQKRNEALRSDKCKKNSWQPAKSRSLSCRPDGNDLENHFESVEHVNACARLNPFPRLFKGLSKGRASSEQRYVSNDKLTYGPRSQSYSFAATRKLFDETVNHNGFTQVTNGPENVLPRDSSRNFKLQQDFNVQNSHKIVSSTPIEMYQSGSNWSLAPSRFNPTPEIRPTMNTPTKTSRSPLFSGRHCNPSKDMVRHSNWNRIKPPKESAFRPWNLNVVEPQRGNLFENYECEQRASKSHPDISSVEQNPTGYSGNEITHLEKENRCSKSTERCSYNLSARRVQIDNEKMINKKSPAYLQNVKPESRNRNPIHQVTFAQPKNRFSQKNFRDLDDNEFYSASTTEHRISPRYFHPAQQGMNTSRSKSFPRDTQSPRFQGKPENTAQTTINVGLKPSSTDNVSKLTANHQPRYSKTTYIPGRFPGVNALIQDTTVRNTVVKKTLQYTKNVETRRIEKSEAKRDQISNTDSSTKQNLSNGYYHNERHSKSQWNTVLRELSNQISRPESQILQPPLGAQSRQSTEKKLILSNTSKSDLVDKQKCFQMTVNIPLKQVPSTINKSKSSKHDPTDLQNHVACKPKGNVRTTASIEFSANKPKCTIATKASEDESNTAAKQIDLNRSNESIFNLQLPQTYPSLFDILHHCDISRIVLDPNIPCSNDQLGLVLRLSKFPLDDIQRANCLQIMKDADLTNVINITARKESTHLNGFRSVIQNFQEHAFKNSDSRTDLDAPEVITVHAIVPNTPASIEGSLSNGMLILEINGEPLIQTSSTQSKNLLRLAQHRLRSAYFAAKQCQAPMVKMTAAKYHNRFGLENKLNKPVSSEHTNGMKTQEKPEIPDNKLPNSVVTDAPLSKFSIRNRLATEGEIDSRSETTTDASTARNSDVYNLKDMLEWFPTWNMVYDQKS